MKRFLLLNIVFFLLMTSISFAAPKKKITYHAFAPNGVKNAIFLKTGAKRYSYYEVERGSTLDFEIVGPVLIKIDTRAQITYDSIREKYQIQLWEGDSLRASRKVEAALAPVSGADRKFGIARSLTYKSPAGKHSYRLWLVSDKIGEYYVRFYQQVKAKKKATLLPYKPLEYKKKVSLPGKKKSVGYYLVDNNGGVSLTIVGPTVLVIYCRENFDQNMKGNSKFTLEMLEFGKAVKQFSEIGAIAPVKTDTRIR